MPKPPHRSRSRATSRFGVVLGAAAALVVLNASAAYASCAGPVTITYDSNGDPCVIGVAGASAGTPSCVLGNPPPPDTYSTIYLEPSVPFFGQFGVVSNDVRCSEAPTIPGVIGCHM